MRLIRSLVSTAALVLLSVQSLSAQPVPIRKEHAYAGAQRPAGQLATVYGQLQSPPFPISLEWTFICEVDGKSYRAAIAVSVCPSVVYLLPGSYKLDIGYRVGNAGAEGSIPIRVEAGRTYLIEPTRPASMAVSFRVKPMPSGFVLTHKDVMPGAYTGSRQNSPIDPAK